MTISELKTYIYKENKIEFVLQEIGCHHIVYHQNKEYYSCGNIDGDNKSCVTVKNNEYLNVTDYTRETFFDDKSDIITLVQYNLYAKHKKHTTWEAVKNLHKILDLELSFKKEEKKKEKIDPLQIFKKVKTRQQIG